MTGNPLRSGWRDRAAQSFPPVGLFAGGLVFGMVPRGAFGMHDVAVRAAITDAAAAVAFLLVAAGLRRLRLG